MSVNEQKQTSSISKAMSYEEIGEYWDTHSLDDHWDTSEEAEFEVRAKRKHRVAVDQDVYARLETEARSRGVVPETLVNLWIAERLDSSGAK